MLTDTELIRKLDFFQHLDQKVLNNIAKACILKHFAAGDFIVRQGQPGLGLYFISEGRARVEISRNGTRSVVAELQDGDFLGELSVLDDKARSADVICIEDTRCLLLTHDDFTKLINKYPQIALEMAKSLVTRVRTTPVRSPVDSTGAPAPSSAPAHPAAASEPEAAQDKASSNGTLLSQYNPIDLYTSTKGKTRDFLVDTFKSLSVLKMMTRFSAAIVGCPVTVEAQGRRDEVLQANLGGVKLALFPSSHGQVLNIRAFGNGDFSATVFRASPRGGSPYASVDRFQGQICKDETWRLHIPARRRSRLERL